MFILDGDALGDVVCWTGSAPPVLQPGARPENDRLGDAMTGILGYVRARAARAKGKRPVRQPLHPDRIAAALKLVDAGLSPTAATRQLGLGRSTVYREMAAAGLARTFQRAGALVCVGISICTLVGHTREAQAQVTHICWIEHVKQTAQGVDIYFMKTMTRVLRNRTWEDMPLASITIDGKEVAYPHVSTVLGDELFLANSPEDGCSIKVAMQDGSIGVIARAYFNPPGLPRATSTQVIPAAPMKP